jgi:hypothetical protein
MGMIHEAIEWFRVHPDALAGLETPQWDWREIADGIGLIGDMSEKTIDFIGTWPDEMRNILMLLLASQGRGESTVRMSWAPAYDFTMTISKANFGEGAEYAVQLGSKYPPEVAGI